jgi:hypothetical protein
MALRAAESIASKRNSSLRGRTASVARAFMPAGCANSAASASAIAFSCLFEAKVRRIFPVAFGRIFKSKPTDSLDCHLHGYVPLQGPSFQVAVPIGVRRERAHSGFSSAIEGGSTGFPSVFGCALRRRRLGAFALASFSAARALSAFSSCIRLDATPARDALSAICPSFVMGV